MAIKAIRPPTVDDGASESLVERRAPVTQALLDLLRDGDLRPTPEDVELRSGVSVRTIFRLFPDLHTLFASAYTAQLQQVAPLLELADDVGAGRAERIDGLVRRRERLYEAIGGVKRASILHAPFSEKVGECDAFLRSRLRLQLEWVFAGELAGLSTADRQRLTTSLEAATSWTVWNRLRTSQDLSSSKARAVLSGSVAAMISSICGPAADD